MEQNMIIAAVSAAAALFVIFRSFRKNGAAAIRMALLGAASLILLHHFQGDFGLDIPLNAFNLAGSMILGIPFLICLVVIRIC